MNRENRKKKKDAAQTAFFESGGKRNAAMEKSIRTDLQSKVDAGKADLIGLLLTVYGMTDDVSVEGNDYPVQTLIEWIYAEEPGTSSYSAWCILLAMLQKTPTTAAVQLGLKKVLECRAAAEAQENSENENE